MRSCLIPRLLHFEDSIARAGSNTTARGGAKRESADVALMASPRRYVANENADADGKSYVVAVRVDTDTGALAEINRQESCGAGCCHVEWSGSQAKGSSYSSEGQGAPGSSGCSILAANYGTGSVASFAIGVDGEIMPATDSKQACARLLHLGCASYLSFHCCA